MSKGTYPMPVTRVPDDVEIVTIGGYGGHDGIILPWALHSEGIVEPQTLPDGKEAKSRLFKKLTNNKNNIDKNKT